jgi:hypothetical protein
MASIMAQRSGVSSMASSRAARPSKASVVAPRAALLTQVRSSSPTNHLAAASKSTLTNKFRILMIIHRQWLVRAYSDWVLTCMHHMFPCTSCSQ